uniref:Uncharacterized protein n=1 Tax=Phaeomonas parva TaxID=124430 RepID=A0A7S1U5X2_9STRA|mmetsp:Transcript_30467/g.97216  ORF Transcript_30467/g.97216 Transcript_30467/m.97216 type:complete len:908 (+) Transcript_30467:882-3605(+)
MELHRRLPGLFGQDKDSPKAQPPAEETTKAPPLAEETKELHWEPAPTPAPEPEPEPEPEPWLTPHGLVVPDVDEPEERPSAPQERPSTASAPAEPASAERSTDVSGPASVAGTEPDAYQGYSPLAFAMNNKAGRAKSRAFFAAKIREEERERARRLYEMQSGSMRRSSQSPPPSMRSQNQHEPSPQEETKEPSKPAAAKPAAAVVPVVAVAPTPEAAENEEVLSSSGRETGHMRQDSGLTELYGASFSEKEARRQQEMEAARNNKFDEDMYLRKRRLPFESTNGDDLHRGFEEKEASTPDTEPFDTTYGLRQRNGRQAPLENPPEDEEQLLRQQEEEEHQRHLRHHEHDRDDDEGGLKVILEAATESNVESIVEIGAICCLSGRMPGVSIFYALILFVVVAIASGVLMTAAVSSYEGVPCEEHAECLEGSFCTIDDTLGTCTSCVVRKTEPYEFYIFFKDIFNPDDRPMPEFTDGDRDPTTGLLSDFNSLENPEDFNYLCPKFLEDPNECNDRCEAPIRDESDDRCLASQYLTYFSVDEPATLVVAVFTILFFALLSRQQQQQSLLAFFYMRHPVQYKPLKELSRRMKKKKRAYEKAKGPPRRTGAIEDKGVDELEMPPDVLSDDGILDDIVNPIDDDASSAPSEGTIEAKYKNYQLIMTTYSGAVAQMALQTVAVPLMRIALFMELISLRTAILVSTVTIMFANATILDFLVNSLAVLFVLDLDEMLFVAVNQSFPGIVDTYIKNHQDAELEAHRKEIIREKRVAAHRAGVPFHKLRLELRELDHGFQPTLPEIHLTSFETNLLRAACMVHSLSIFLYCMDALQAPNSFCFLSAEEFLRYVLGTGITMLYLEVIFFTMIHYTYSYYQEGNSMSLLPFFLLGNALFEVGQFLAVLIFQLAVFEVLKA